MLRYILINWEEKAGDTKQKKKKQGMCSMLPLVFKQFCKTIWDIGLNNLVLSLEGLKKTITRNHLWGREVVVGWVEEKKEKRTSYLSTSWIFYWYMHDKQTGR